jgi:hypothetical protein
MLIRCARICWLDASNVYLGSGRTFLSRMSRLGDRRLSFEF